MQLRKYSVIAVLLLALLGGGCDEPAKQAQAPSTPPPQSAPVTKPTPPPPPPVAAKPVDPVDAFVFPKEGTMAWPFMAGDQRGEGLANDLLAKNYIVVYDGSGSMDERACKDNRDKHTVAKEAVKEWVKTIPVGPNIGSVIFNRDRWIRIAPAANASSQIVQAIYGISPGSGTPLATAIKTAYTMLTLQAQNQLGYGEYVIVVLTDGINNDRDENFGYWISRILSESPVQIYTIGFCIGTGHELNDPKRMVYREAGNLTEIRQGLAEVLAEAETFDITSFPTAHQNPKK